ncbi:unnamed protein product [Amoebophrya sp. A120]|nr:unnamed protein product [Amoebophrya sp. A120]|eukprot:GSA120T00024255001.1
MFWNESAPAAGVASRRQDRGTASYHHQSAGRPRGVRRIDPNATYQEQRQKVVEPNVPSALGGCIPSESETRSDVLPRTTDNGLHGNNDMSRRTTFRHGGAAAMGSNRPSFHLHKTEEVFAATSPAAQDGFQTFDDRDMFRAGTGSNRDALAYPGARGVTSMMEGNDNPYCTDNPYLRNCSKMNNASSYQQKPKTNNLMRSHLKSGLASSRAPQQIRTEFSKESTGIFPQSREQSDLSTPQSTATGGAELRQVLVEIEGLKARLGKVETDMTTMQQAVGRLEKGLGQLQQSCERRFSYLETNQSALQRMCLTCCGKQDLADIYKVFSENQNEALLLEFEQKVAPALDRLAETRDEELHTVAEVQQAQGALDAAIDIAADYLFFKLRRQTIKTCRLRRHLLAAKDCRLQSPVPQLVSGSGVAM